jgi:hypothetical protein
VAINDTSEESYESILAEAKTDSPISMAKPSTMERTGEMVEGKVDNKRKIMKNRTGGWTRGGWPGPLRGYRTSPRFSNISSWMYEAALPCLLLVIEGN